MELLINHSIVSFRIFSPRVSPLELSTSDVNFIHRGDYRPSQIHLTTSDPLVQIDQTVGMSWERKLWRTVMNPDADPFPLYEYQSNPVRVAEEITEAHQHIATIN